MKEQKIDRNRRSLNSHQMAISNGEHILHEDNCETTTSEQQISCMALTNPNIINYNYFMRTSSNTQSIVFRSLFIIFRCDWHLWRGENSLLSSVTHKYLRLGVSFTFDIVALHRVRVIIVSKHEMSIHNSITIRFSALQFDGWRYL